MFGDIVKIATRTAAVAVVIGAIVGVFAVIHLPSPDYSFFSTLIGKGYAMMSHWIPGFPTLWGIFTAVFGTWLAVQTMRFAIYSASIVLKIFQ